MVLWLHNAISLCVVMCEISGFPVGPSLIAVIMTVIFRCYNPILYHLLKMGKECGSIYFMTIPLVTLCSKCSVEAQLVMFIYPRFQQHVYYITIQGKEWNNMYIYLSEPWIVSIEICKSFHIWRIYICFKCFNFQVMVQNYCKEYTRVNWKVLCMASELHNPFDKM